MSQNPRLIQVEKENIITEEYSYDSNENRQSATVNNQTITASYTYDDDGYLQEKVTPNGTTTYTYGTLGELKEVVTPTKTITYLQNANNQRVAKLVDGVMVEKYLWANLTTLLAVYDGADNLVQRFEYADARMPVAMMQNGQKYYLHYDQVGSLRAISDTNGNVVKEITYDTFGNILSDTNPTFKVPFGFAGGLYDVDTKLTRFGYRDYDAYTGKWTAKDPIGFAGGDSNLYGYVLGDPVGFVDPSGLFEIAIPFNPISINPASVAAAGSTALVLGAGYAGYNAGYGLAEWWDNYNDSSVTDDVACLASQRGKKNIDNEYTDDVLYNGIKDPCKYLRALYNSTKNSIERKKIRAAQKRFGCDGKSRFE